MKRTRDDVFPGSQFKRPFAASRVESHVQSQITVYGSGGSSSQKLTTNDALTYLKEVKEMFQDQREKYDTFLEVMKDFKAQKTDTAGVIQRVKELFKGHNNLILGFNTFLPKGYEITLDEDEATKKTVEFEEAISFVNKIKKRFQNDEHVYKSFLDILNMYRKEHKDINEVYSEVATLFYDHPDLLDEFTRFLPNNSEVPVQTFPYVRAPAPPCGERSSVLPMSRQVHTDKQRRRDKVHTSRVERDRSVDRPDIDDEKAVLKIQKDQRKQKDNQDKKNHEHGDRESEQDNKDFNGHLLSEKRKSSKKVEGSGMSSGFAINDDKDALKGMYSEGFMFCEKVKERLSSSDDYQAFLKCLNIYSNGIIKRNDLQNLVTDLLGKHRDLMDEFNDFLERCENIDGFLAGVMSKKSLIYDGPVHKSMKVDDKEKVRKNEMDEEKERERSKEKYWAKSIQELDLSDCQRCTPSYRLLPDDYPIPTASQRSQLGAQVLNDHWVSVTSGSEDYSFKHMRRNQFEESLFRCEDDRFELDMLIESVSSTTKRAEELLNTANESKTSLETPFQVENHFTALHMRCIERLYGDHGLDVIDILRKKPTTAIPVILARLKQKQEEWTKCHSDFNMVWADVYAKNHYKSLDHRSFYFKQLDSKILSTKNLVAEIKELKEKQQKEEDHLLAIAAGNQHLIFPQLDYKFTDERIHEDLYKLFEYSCEEICPTKEQLYKVMRLWTTFLEPVLGVPSRNREGSEFVGKNIESDKSLNLKQDKSEKHKEGNLSLMNFSRPGLMNGDVSGKEHDCMESERGLGDDSSSTTQKELKCMVRTKNQSTSSEAARVGCSVASSNATTFLKNDLDSKVDADTIPLLTSALAKLSWCGIPKDDPKVDKSEKEEGELSPNCEFEENPVEFKEDDGKDLGMQINEHGNHSANGEETHDLVRGIGNGAEADDEDSGNASVRGDISCSESAGNECSHEENEEVNRNEADLKAESEGEAEGMADAHCIGGDCRPLPFSDRFLSLSKPLAKRVQAVLHEEAKYSRVFYGNDDFYVLFRLHQTLYERILSAKTNCCNAEKQKNLNHSDSPDLYSRFMDALYNLLDGSIDNAKFEDKCREIIGNQSYVLFTLDKLIYKLVKQFQLIASDEMDSKLLQLYEYERSRRHVEMHDSVYYENAHVYLLDENIYRMKFSVLGLSIQLMDNICEKPEAFAISIEPNFAAYLHSEFLLAAQSRKEQTDLYLHRNKLKYIEMDEDAATCMALEGVRQFNGLECKISCISSKISYVLDTEDFFFRPRSKRLNTSRTTRSSRRVHRFHRFLSNRIAS